MRAEDLKRLFSQPCIAKYALQKVDLHTYLIKIGHLLLDETSMYMRTWRYTAVTVIISVTPMFVFVRWTDVCSIIENNDNAPVVGAAVPEKKCFKLNVA